MPNLAAASRATSSKLCFCITSNIFEGETIGQFLLGKFLANGLGAVKHRKGTLGDLALQNNCGQTRFDENRAQ